MFFSEYFHVNPQLLLDNGVVNISLACDLPLFVDPMLIFNSDKNEYKKLHDKIIKYFYFLSRKAKQSLSNSEIKAWFSFNEVKNNWLGYSIEGNEGLALGMKFARFLYENIEFAIETNGISESPHIEKTMLLYKNNGKDKISDLTVNLIKEYLLEYTEKFALEHINPLFISKVPVDKAYFNYDTESFVSKEYDLPFIYDKKGKIEYVLLTPSDILRRDEPSINRKDFINSHERIRASIDNDDLRVFINNYISMSVKRYKDEQIRNKKKYMEKTIFKIEKEAFDIVVRDYPELYDYYIKLRENDKNIIKANSTLEVETQIQKLLINATNLINLIMTNGFSKDESFSALEESKRRILFFKHIIENCDGYRNLYTSGEKIANENDLQRLFKFVWYGTSYKADYEVNNGRGHADAIISKGQYNQSIVEFKLASNSKLNKVFNQLAIYKAANQTKEGLVVICYFTLKEYEKTHKLIVESGCVDEIDNTVFLIDCRNDNKLSASVA